jgi:NADH-quinone oxidoreductase subunit A
MSPDPMVPPNPLDPYLPLLIVLLLAGGMAVAISGLATVLGPKRTGLVKSLSFEAGSAPSGNARQRFAVKFYVVALLFVVFDVEAVFLYPWAVQFRELGWFGFVAMGIFVVMLTVALVYEWAKGALEWES